MAVTLSKKAGSEQEHVSQSLGVLLVCRLVLAGSVLVAGRTLFRQDPSSTTLLFVAAAILLVTVLYVRMLRRSYPAVPLLHVQIGADLMVITWVVAITGGIESPFVLLYFVSIILAGSFLLVKGAVIAATAASIGFLTVCVGHLLRGAEAPHAMEMLRCGIDVAFFFLVGGLSGYLGRNTRRQHVRLQRAKSELQRVKLDTDCIVRNMGSGLLTVDSTETVTHFNPAGAAILRVGSQKLDGAGLSGFDEMGMAPLASAIRNTLAEGRGIPRREMDLPLDDGRTIPVGVSTSVVLDEDGVQRGAVAVFQDLTDVREMEQRARRNQTLAAVGELAAAVAHEIRNCLSPISGSAEVLARELKVEGENKQLLGLILRESRRLESFMSTLLDFARVKPLVIEELDLKDVLKEVLEAARRHPAFAHQLSLQMPREAESIAISGDREQLHQAFLNLVINALEAMPNGGSLRVSASYHPTSTPGRCGSAAVEFADTGVGLTPEQMMRVFEPFFTTKKRGSGLGLAVVRQVIERHGGSVEVESERGKGSVVRVELPCQAMEALRAA